jgi:serine/threonine-protein kinase ATR
LILPKPEVVPFRLTQNMLDAFGPTGADGVYSTSLHQTMTTLRENRDTLLSVLEPFVNDPIIDWKRYRSQQKHKVEERHAKEAKRSIQVIDERLQGIYNLQNPNLKRLGNLIGRSGVGADGIAGSDDDLQHMVPLTVEGQVHKMISEATSSENLVQQYVGWMPWV